MVYSMWEHIECIHAMSQIWNTYSNLSCEVMVKQRSMCVGHRFNANPNGGVVRQLSFDWVIYFVYTVKAGFENLLIIIW